MKLVSLGLSPVATRRVIGYAKEFNLIERIGYKLNGGRKRYFTIQEVKVLIKALLIKKNNQKCQTICDIDSFLQNLKNIIESPKDYLIKISKEDKVTNSNMLYRNLISKEHINKVKNREIPKYLS